MMQTFLTFGVVLVTSGIAAIVLSKYAVEEAKRERARLALRAAARRASTLREREPLSVQRLKTASTLLDLESLSVTTGKEFPRLVEQLQMYLAMLGMHEKLALMGQEIQPLSPEKTPLPLLPRDIVLESPKREPRYLSEAFVINHRMADD